LSNYSSWQVSWHFTSKTAAMMHQHLKQVAEIVGIATHHDWVKPTAYQGGYNAIERTVETECVR
jgi:hypothetical protein